MRTIIHRLLFACLLTVAGGPMVLTAENVKFLRYPNIANDGSIAFSYHGDIWVVQPDGQSPRRLTAHIARDTFPRFSPDGQWLAFNSDRMGNNDVWLIKVAGGSPRQLTCHSTADTVQSWTPDGSGVVIATSRGAAPWGSPLYIAPIGGGIPQPMAMDRAATGMIRQDGKVIAFNRGGFRYWRKHYRGNNNTDIWLQDLESGEISQLTDLDLQKYREHTQDAFPMWGADGQIYFMSERSGIFNIWKIAPGGGEPTQVTFHQSDGIQYPSISPDGKSIVYENEFEIWKLDVASGQTRKMPLEMSFDPKENRLDVAESKSQADGFAVSPDGQSLAVDYHGEIFVVPVDPELGEMTQVTDSPWRDRNQAYSPDGKKLAYVSDESGEEEIWIYDLESRASRKLTSHPSLKQAMVWSPDSQKILFHADNRLVLADLETGASEELNHNPEGGFRGVRFHRDGKWLVYSRSDADLDSEVYLFDIDNRREWNVTQSRFSESAGRLTGDGKYVVFVSDREGSSQIFRVSLAKLREDPNDPLVKKKKKKRNGSGNKGGKQKPEGKPSDGQPADSNDAGDAGDAGDSAEGDAEAPQADDKPAVQPLKIDLDRIRDRAEQLTRGSDSIRGFEMAPDGKTLYFQKGGALYSLPVVDGKEKKIADGSFRSLTFNQKGDTIFYRDGSAISKMSAKGSGKKKIEFELRVYVDREQEWKQIFDESWRVMKYRFYDEDMHGYDWPAIKQKYEPLLRYVGENQDLYDLCNEMIGELNASHTGVSGPPTRSMKSLYSTRHLGFEVEPAGQYYRVSHIYRNGPADKEWLQLAVGDLLLEIENQPIRYPENYHQRLNRLLNDYVDITVATPRDQAGPRDDDLQAESVPGDRRHLRIRAASSMRGLKYRNWVEDNRQFVDEASGGKLGYVHIRSMNRTSLEQFEKEINQFWNKNGMIIDIRFNGGGNIDQQLIDILERKPYEYWNSRHGGRARGRRPRQAIAGPKIMLINWRSASDSEVTPQAFRDLKLGRIVGNPTYGAVIATGSYQLINGGRMRTPGALVVTYDPSRPNNYGINLENFGVAPDVWVENSPQDELAGFDRELKAAVDEGLQMLRQGTWQYGEDQDLPAATTGGGE